MNGFGNYWVAPTVAERVGDWAADAVGAVRSRSRSELLAAMALALGLVAAVAGIRSAATPSIAYAGPAHPKGWRPLSMIDGKPQPNPHACGSIRYGIDPRGSADPTFAEDARRAAEVIQRASGIPLHFVGEIDARAVDVNPDVVITWASRNAFTNAGAIGEADTIDGGGTILLARWMSAEPGPNGWGAVLLHEWGHIIGLDHVNDPTSIMHPVVLGVAPNGADRAGLWALGRGSCR